MFRWERNKLKVIVIVISLDRNETRFNWRIEEQQNSLSYLVPSIFFISPFSFSSAFNLIEKRATQMDVIRLCCCLVTKSCPTNCLATPWTVACQTLLSVGFPRQEYWSGLTFSSLGDLPHLGIKPLSPAWQVDSLPLSHLGSPSSEFTILQNCSPRVTVWPRDFSPTKCWCHLVTRCMGCWQWPLISSWQTLFQELCWLPPASF